jgi:hypothetical protein
MGWQRRQQGRCEIGYVRVKRPCGAHERERDEAENAEAVLDDPESAQPEHHPREDGDRQDPPLETNAGEQLHRDGRASDLGGQQQQIDSQFGGQGNQVKVNSEPFAHGGCEGSFAHRREPARHLHEHGHHHRGGGNGPQQLEAELRSRLRGGRNRPDLDEAADARHDAEDEIDDTAHAGGRMGMRASS